MSALGKYYIIEAESLEAIKRYRAFIEDKLKSQDLSPEYRVELEWALKRAWDKQAAAQKTADEEEEEENKKKEGEGEGESGGNQQGNAGSAGGSSGDGGGASRESDEDESAHKDDDSQEFDSFSLLLFLAEQDIDQHAPDFGDDAALPSAAATLLLDKEDGIAQVSEAYTLGHEDHAHAPSEFVPCLERHAASLGARMLQLKVHPDAVALFQKKLGYVPHGKAFSRNGAPVQRMRKSLANCLLFKNDTVT